ncbi:MAG: hypothetical protein HYR84_06555 [Planctomycetes bacterium]|nr:hypothetical protein [Planctomycetota bacterium]
MSKHLLIGAVALAFGVLAARGMADPPGEGPSNRGVLLPPQMFDDAAKRPNHERERHGEWSINGGVYLMTPVFETNPAFLVNSAQGNVVRQVDFGHRLDVAPFVGLGYASERGWGVRGRWFQFDHGATAGHTAAPGEAVTGISSFAQGRAPLDGAVTASSRLAVNVMDVEGTCHIETAKWSHLLGIGMRYAHMSQDYRAAVVNANTFIDLTSGHNLNGIGPEFSLETKRRIGETGFAIYGQMHGAILFGRAKEIQSAVVNAVPMQFSRHHTDVLPVGELEVGVEYQRSIGRVKVFGQAGFQGQAWWGGGNASNLDPVGFSSAANSNFGFVGAALRVGVRY